MKQGKPKQLPVSPVFTGIRGLMSLAWAGITSKMSVMSLPRHRGRGGGRQRRLSKLGRRLRTYNGYTTGE